MSYYTEEHGEIGKQYNGRLLQNSKKILGIR